MVSERKLAANRRNALKSTGPRTEAGKRVSSLNGLKHGLRSRRPLETYPDIREWHTAQCDAITADLGGPGELTALAVATVRETARLVIVCDWLGDTLLASGPLTGKGRGTTKPKNASAQSG